MWIEAWGFRGWGLGAWGMGLWARGIRALGLGAGGWVEVEGYLILFAPAWLNVLKKRKDF